MSTSSISPAGAPPVDRDTTTDQAGKADPTTARKLKLAQAKLQTDTSNKADAATLKADRAALVKAQAVAGNSRKGTNVNTYA